LPGGSPRDVRILFAALSFVALATLSLLTRKSMKARNFDGCT